MAKGPNRTSRTKSKIEEASVRVARASYSSNHGKDHAITRIEIVIRSMPRPINVHGVLRVMSSAQANAKENKNVFYGIPKTYVHSAFPNIGFILLNRLVNKNHPTA